MIRASLLVLVVVSLLGCAVAQARVDVIITVGPRPCGPPIYYSPRSCAPPPMWRPAPCGPTFTPGYFPGTPPISGGGDPYGSGYGYSRRDEIRREQQQLSAENNVIRARQNAERAYARWQDLKRCNSWRDQVAYNNWRHDVLSAERSFLDADEAYREALGRYQCGGW